MYFLQEKELQKKIRKLEGEFEVSKLLYTVVYSYFYSTTLPWLSIPLLSGTSIDPVPSD